MYEITSFYNKKACKFRGVKKEHRERIRSAIENYVKTWKFVANALVLVWLVLGAIQFPCCYVFLWRDGSNHHRRELAEPKILAVWKGICLRRTPRRPAQDGLSLQCRGPFAIERQWRCSGFVWSSTCLQAELQKIAVAWMPIRFATSKKNV